MNAIRFLLAAALLLAALAPQLSASGSPPELMSYQGYLVDANGVPLGIDAGGNPLPSNYDVTFSIFAASSGGSLLWREQQTITVDAGYFSVLLGEGTQVGSDPRPNLSNVFTGIGADERFIGVAVRFEAGGEFSDILPRLRLLSSPFAFLSSQARSLVNPDGQALITVEGSAVTIAGTLTTTQALIAPSISGNGANLTNINASNISTGTLNANRVPSLDASKINSGTLHANRVPSLDAIKITSGVFASARIPNLNASTITAGTLNVARLDNSVVRTNREQTFTARQRFQGNAQLDDRILYIRGGNDTHHGLAYASSAGPGGFNIGTIDGPLLWGNGGGGLGVSNLSSGSFAIPLRWTFNRVDVHGVGSVPHGIFQVYGWSYATFGHITTSSRETKENFAAVDELSVLNQLRELPVSEWSYIEGDGSRHIGPMAEDFYEAFGLSSSNTVISVSDMSGVALVAIKALDKTVKEQAAEIADLRETVAELQAAVAVLLQAQSSGQ